MDKVVLITGASSGIGMHTAKLFQAKSWKVAATMRDPEKAVDLQKIVDVECFRLDVTDVDSIRSAIAQAIDKFGRIDAVVNNAGYGMLGAFESVTVEQIEQQFQTNIFGMMNVCREILPYFREQERGLIINVGSLIGRVAMPCTSIYASSKWAVEGFSEALQYEVRDFNIRIKLIEPGPIKTEFYGESLEIGAKDEARDYYNFNKKALASFRAAGSGAPDGEIVAQAIFNAASDGSRRLRYNVNTKGLLLLRKILPDSLFFPIVRTAIMR